MTSEHRCMSEAGAEALAVLDGIPAAKLSAVHSLSAPRWLDYAAVYPAGQHTVVGAIKVLSGLYSPQLDNHRDILVYLPKRYKASQRRYPVLYMHDGQNLFDAANSFTGEWRVDETLEELADQGIEAIVVGIPNIGARRHQEYIPFPSPDLPDAAGDQYVTFVADTLKPIIDRDFRTQPDREHTGIMGSSLGGLISLYAFFRRPDVFGLVGAVSPSLRWGNQAIFPFVEGAKFVPGRVYLDVGTAEGTKPAANAPARPSSPEGYVQQVRRMSALLVRRGYRIGEDLLYVEEEGGIHHESAWARRLPAALRFLLG